MADSSVHLVSRSVFRDCTRYFDSDLTRSIGSIQFQVADLDTALYFHRDKLGHEVRWRTETHVALTIPDGKPEIVLQTDRDEPETGLIVGSVIDAVANFLAVGGRVVASPFDIQISRCPILDDPRGNRLVLVDSTDGPLKIDKNGWVIGNEKG